MKESSYKSYDDLPLFLNAETVAKVLGVSISSAYELMHEPGFPVLKVGSRLVVPRACLKNRETCSKSTELQWRQGKRRPRRRRPACRIW